MQGPTVAEIAAGVESPNQNTIFQTNQFNTLNELQLKQINQINQVNQIPRILLSPISMVKPLNTIWTALLTRK